MQQGELSPETFNKICNLTSEYGTQLKNTYAYISYFEEHFEPLIKYDALQKLIQTFCFHNKLKQYLQAIQSSLKLTVFPLFSMLSGVAKNNNLSYNK